jgi:hypothetical protein
VEKTLTIVLPTRPQPDTLVAIFLIKEFGNEKFPGVKDAQIDIQPLLPQESFENLLQKGILAIDVGGGPLDHHGKNTCASQLVAKMFEIENDPSVSKLLAYAMRDDREGRGIVSVDPLDRSFGLSGLIGSLNKQYQSDPQKVVDYVLPLLEAHYHSAREYHVELPREVEQRKSDGQYEESLIKQGTRKIKIVSITSSKSSMPAYLRSWNGPRADLVIQKSEAENRICVISRQDRHINLSVVAALIRMREAQVRNLPLQDDDSYLMQHGKIAELPFWYFDPATNSILNVGNEATDNSEIPWSEFTSIVLKGLEMAPEIRVEKK